MCVDIKVLCATMHTHKEKHRLSNNTNVKLWQKVFVLEMLNFENSTRALLLEEFFLREKYFWLPLSIQESTIEFQN